MLKINTGYRQRLISINTSIRHQTSPLPSVRNAGKKTTLNLEPGTSFRRGFGWQSLEPETSLLRQLADSAGKAWNLEF